MIRLFPFNIWAVPSAYAQDIRDIKSPVDLPPNYLLFCLLFGILALAAALITTHFLRKRYTSLQLSVAKAPAPWDIAYDRLKELQLKNLPEKGQIKEFYIQLSDIVRRYIENRFHMKAPEMTTPEFLWSLQDSRDLTNLHKELLNNFLNACDLVKFARYAPSRQEIDESFQAAHKFVDETKLSSSIQAQSS